MYRPVAADSFTGGRRTKEGSSAALRLILGRLPPECQRPCSDAPNGKPIREFRGAWRKACKQAGVPGTAVSRSRRTAARNMRRAGTAEGIIMEIRRWRAQSVFERYAIVSQQDIRDAVRKLETSEIGHIIAMIL